MNLLSALIPDSRALWAHNSLSLLLPSRTYMLLRAHEPVEIDPTPVQLARAEALAQFVRAQPGLGRAQIMRRLHMGETPFADAISILQRQGRIENRGMKGRIGAFYMVGE